MEYYNICTKRTYQKQGETKTIWMKCGTLKILDDGKKFIELFMHPDTSFYVFEQKKKEDAQKENELEGKDWDA